MLVSKYPEFHCLDSSLVSTIERKRPMGNLIDHIDGQGAYLCEDPFLYLYQSKASDTIHFALPSTCSTQTSPSLITLASGSLPVYAIAGRALLKAHA